MFNQGSQEESQLAVAWHQTGQRPWVGGVTTVLDLLPVLLPVLLSVGVGDIHTMINALSMGEACARAKVKTWPVRLWGKVPWDHALCGTQRS